jgi:hypothetical protein
VYTAAELISAGITGPLYITQFGFYLVTAPNLALANFVIRMKHTSATTVASWIPGTDLQTVYSAAAYMPVVGGYDMLTLSTPFLWNGIDNIVIDTAFGMLASYSNSGTLQTTNLNNGYMRSGSDTANQTDVFTGGAVRNWRPNIRLALVSSELSIPQVSHITQSQAGTTLQWSSVPNAGGYQIYRATSPNGVYNYLGSSAGLQYMDTEVLPSAFYFVKAVSSIRKAGL